MTIDGSFTAHYWTPERMERLVELYAGGAPWVEIMREMGVSEYACRNAIRRHSQIVRRPRTIDLKVWTPQDVNALCGHVAEFSSVDRSGKQHVEFREVALRLNRSEGSCRQKWLLLTEGGAIEPPSNVPKRACIGRFCCGKPKVERMFQPEHKHNFLCKSCGAGCSTFA